MRTLVFNLATLFLIIGLQAATKTIKVTPETLGPWTVVGADKTALAEQRDLSLPANASLVRSFSAPEVAVKLVTQPVFAQDPQDWPVLEIGSAALILLQSGTEGRLALVIGDNVPVLLPIAVPLDATGRSTTPLEVDFARSGQGVTVSALGQTLSYPADALTGNSFDVAASTGASANWPLPDFEVTVPEPTVATATGTDLSSGSSDSTGQGGIVASASRDALSTKLGLSTPSGGSNALAGPSNSSTSSPPVRSTLEVFTPPSVRHGKIEAIRAAVAQSL